jgi:Transposase DDE domain
MTASVAVPADPQASTAWDLFHKLLPAKLLNDLDPKAPQAAYTPWVVTWLLVFQRLHGNASLNDAVGEFTLRFPQQALPDCQRAQQQRLSANSGAYSLARTNLDRRVLDWAAQNLYDTLVPAYPPSWGDRRVFILDGSTVQLAPTPALRAAYPPASNQHGTSHWPVLHLVVAHELASGLAVRPQYGPMYGPQAQSELALAQRLLPRLPQRSILLADRNFGVFAFAWAAVAAGHDVLLRLTKPRFEALRKKARQLAEGKWELAWHPSAWDRKSHPELPQAAVVRGTLHEVKVSERLTLWLFTTLLASGAELAQLYHKRQDVETDIRDLKETLALGEMSGKSVAMVEKELVAAQLAYNLANQVRRLAAERLKLEPRRLSFAGVWSLLKAFAQGLLADKTGAQAEADFERLLRAAGQRKLPRRPKGRSYPRQVIPRGRKFPTRKRDQNMPPQ